jgi:Flp pilus assembly protein TadG
MVDAIRNGVSRGARMTPSGGARQSRLPRRQALTPVCRRFLAETVAGPIVEFAVVVPVLLLILFGIVDFARAFAQRNNLVAAVREGARFAATRNTPCESTTQDAVRARVLSYFTSVGDAPPAAIAITTTGACPRDVETIRVSITNYPFSTVTPLLRLFGQSSIRLNAAAVYRWEQSP